MFRQHEEGERRGIPARGVDIPSNAPVGRETRARESTGIIVATINGGAPCFSSGGEARVYLVSDLHRSPISGLCSKYT